MDPHLRFDILVVDDDPDIRETVADLLETEGYSVMKAENGREALARLRQHKASLILLDMMMPVMDGWQFRSEQQRDPEIAAIPVVVVSASASTEQEAARMGAAGCMQKPLDLDELLGTIDRLCRDPV